MSTIKYITKKCNQCKELKPMTDFHKNSSSRDGHRSICKDCHNRKRRIVGTGTVYQKDVYVNNDFSLETEVLSDDFVPISPFGTEFTLVIPTGRHEMQDIKLCPVCHEYDVMFKCLLKSGSNEVSILVCNDCIYQSADGYIKFYRNGNMIYIVREYLI